ncbi:MAG: transcriptional repressor, partial [candidate division WOR-3 bacterium]
MNIKIINQYELDKLDRYKSSKQLKTSKKRSLIIQHFLNKDRHFSTEELYNEIKKINPHISYSTVYRALKLLTDCGLAEVRYFKPDVTRFEPVH